MAIYRVKQFLKAISAKITEEDLKLVNQFLSHSEIELFNKLPVYDRKHCINVAKDIMNETTEEKFNKYNKEISYRTLIKAALLHDIGKLYKTLNPIDKSILVLLNKATKSKLKNYKGLKKVHVYYNHGEEGYKLLKDKDYDNKFLDIIKNHHSKDIDCPYVKIIKKYDDKN
jgi:putative nucleotidyltransferase with HDIG domain